MAFKFRRRILCYYIILYKIHFYINSSFLLPPAFFMVVTLVFLCYLDQVSELSIAEVPIRIHTLWSSSDSTLWSKNLYSLQTMPTIIITKLSSFSAFNLKRRLRIRFMPKITRHSFFYLIMSRSFSFSVDWLAPMIVSRFASAGIFLNRNFLSSETDSWIEIECRDHISRCSQPNNSRLSVFSKMLTTSVRIKLKHIKHAHV